MSAAQALIQSTLIGEALDPGPVLVFVADDTMRYVAVNARACEELGYEREELLTLSVTDVCLESGASDRYTAMVEQRVALDGQVTMTRKDGSSFEMGFMAGETRMAGMTFYVSVGRVLA